MTTTTDLSSLVAGMIADVKSGKHRAPRKKGKLLTDKVARQSGMASTHNPWTDEALVMVMYNTRCDSCGNEATSWEQSLFIERVNSRRRSPITQIERIDDCAYSSVYGGLPKRIEVIQKASCTCPLCFGIGDSNHDVLVDNVNPHQLHLFDKESSK